MSRFTGSGIIAATGLAKVMSDNIEDELTIMIGPPAYDAVNRIMYLPGIPGEDIEGDTLRLFRAFLSHEAWERGKSTWSQDPRFLARRTKGLKMLINCINDARIDLEGSLEYPGAGLNVRFALQQDLNALLERNRAEPVQPSVAIIAVLFRYVGEGLMRFEDCWREFPQLRRWLKKVEPWMRNLDLSSEDRCIEQAFEIYDALRSKPSAGNGPAPGTESEEDSATGAVGDDGGEETLPEEAESDHDIDRSLFERLVSHLCSYFDGSTSYTFDTRWDQIYTPTTRSGDPMMPPDLYMAEAHVLTMRLRQTLTVPAPRHVRRQRKGYVDGREVWRVAAFGDEDVMKRRLRRKSDSIACAVSWDESFSMDEGGRIHAVRLLAYIWNEALANLGIPTFLHGWTTRSGVKIQNPVVFRQEAIRHRIYKDFEEDARSDVLKRRLYRIGTGGGTPTGEGLAFAAERLAQRREKRRILFFMTDGMPSMRCNGNYELHDRFIHSTIERCARMGIEVVGIGIKADLSEFFPRWVYVEHPAELRNRAGDALMRVLREGALMR